MGATNCPETPRQKMIGMMYLVLTAMLALNVSVEILNGFVTVGNAMDQSNLNVGSKLADSYIRFDNAKQANPEKVEENYAKAQQVKMLAKELKDFIDQSKYELICVNESSFTLDGKKIPATPDIVPLVLEEQGLSALRTRDESSNCTRFLCGSSEDGRGGRAFEIHQKISNFKNEVAKLLGSDISKVKLGLDVDTLYKSSTDQGKLLNWEQFNFQGTIAIANVVLLSKLKAEVMNAEFDIINFLYSAVSADDFKFDKVQARVVAKSKTVMQGENFEADIFVAAYDSKANLKVKVNGREIIGNEADSGSVRWITPAGGLGVQKYSGEIYVKKETGEVVYPFEGEYFVSMPTAVVSLTNMNVIYAGIDNPFSVSVPGVNNKDVFVSTSAGSIRPDPEGQGGGSYIINITKIAPIVITVEANIDGKRKKMGEFKYRCKSIPPPILKFGKMEGNCSMTPEELLAIGGFKITMKDFEFKIPPLKVSSFSFNVQGSGKSDVVAKNTDRFDPEMRSMISKARRGQKIYIDDVKVTTPDGRTHTLNAIVKMQ